ncbi:MAG: hypothetical protein A2V70_00475 [Planctomycetes bacterium RBG_13_63_9]|nr:MAG: hypothetical protein A2V70_00475 [Planctomycetes bacterium RBG_13_63_9]
MDTLLNKTLSRRDLAEPEVARISRRINRLARAMWWRRVPFSVNTSLRPRWRVRWNKMWEYARGIAYGDFSPGMRVLDFGGSATLPVFYLARLGCEVLSLDIDERLCTYTNEMARQHGWNLTSSTFDLAQNEAPAHWQKFDRIVSYCVIEHIPKHLQQVTLARLASLLKPGGILEMTFDYGEGAPVADAIQNRQEVRQLVLATGLSLIGNREFVDTEERFRLNKRYPEHDYTFGSLFLQNGSPVAA